MCGEVWLNDVWKHIQEDKKEKYSLLMALIPLARMPQDKASASSMERYSKEVERMIGSLTPWQRVSRGNEALRRKVGSGNVKVRLEAGDNPNDPLYKDATKFKE